MSPYEKTMKHLEEEYMRVWDIAESEEREYGDVTDETNNVLICIENEIYMLQNAV